MGITETGIPDCTVELMHGNSATSAVSAVVTCPDLTEIYELARLARSMVVRVPSHASKTNTAFRKIPRLRWFMPSTHGRAAARACGTRFPRGKATTHGPTTRVPTDTARGQPRPRVCLPW